MIGKIRVIWLFVQLWVSLLSLPALAKPEWSIVVHMEVADHLSDVALKSLAELAAVGSNDKIKMYAQVHSFGNQACRYRIEKNALMLEERVTLSFDSQQDLTDALTWGFAHEETEYTMAVLYGHGYGILEPWWHSTINEWQCEFETYQTDAVRDCAGQKQAMLFHKEPRVFLTASGLSGALKAVQLEVLQGRKIDILGFDACMMAMVETSFQVAPYAHYLVGSQACELKEGWYYEQFLKVVAQGNIHPERVVKLIIESYREYYQQHAPESCYTQSAIDLTMIVPVRDSLNKIIAALKDAYVNYGQQLIEILCQLRNKNSGFCSIPMYTDLIGFYVNLADALQEFADSPEKRALMHELENGIGLVERALVATCFGKNNTVAQGISLYFPLKEVDKAYQNSRFAEDSQWVSFLQWITINR